MATSSLATNPTGRNPAAENEIKDFRQQGLSFRRIARKYEPLQMHNRYSVYREGLRSIRIKSSA